MNPDTVKHFDLKELEKTGKDFMKSYKQKIEKILKDIKNNVCAVPPQSLLPTQGAENQNKQNQLSPLRKEII